MSISDSERDHAIAERLREVQARITAAAERSGRRPEEIVLLGAAKYQTPEAVVASIRAGLRHLGENYVQEADAKRALVQSQFETSASLVNDVRWHMIGALQRNKVRLAVTLFDVIETLDRQSLALEIEKRARTAGRQIDAFVQVNLSREEQKAGISEEELPALLESCAPLEHLRITGLMTIPAPSPNPEDSRGDFARLRELRDDLAKAPGGDALRELSMGMSKDFEIAIEEGATVVRVGRDIFGERPAKQAAKPS